MTLFDRACRVSATANGFDPDEVVSGKGWGMDDAREMPRWKWIAEICEKEIRAIIKLVEDEQREQV